MTLKQVLASAIVRLTNAHVPSPRMNAELLLMFTLGCDRAYLFAHPEEELASDFRQRYDAALAERSRGVPAQYITGHQEFWGLDFIVTSDVLIPRPETEHLIEAVLELEAISKNERARGSSALSDDLRIADVGTGSGCIAIALAREFPDARIFGTDISLAALELARANAARHQVEDRIHFRQADLLSGMSNDSLDFVVSNPPYVGESEENQVQFEVRKFEPHGAVFGGLKGTEVIERLIPQAHAALKSGGWLIMEISGSIAEEVQEMLQSWNYVSIRPDLQGIPRVVQARK